MTSPKADALAALAQVETALQGPATIDGLARVQLTATLVYAIGLVEKIEELKRKRKKGATA